MNRIFSSCLAATVFSLAITSSLVAQTPRSITVSASGSANVRPDEVSFSIVLSAGGKSLKEAMESYEESKRKFSTSFNVMKFKGLSLEQSTRQIGAGAGSPVPAAVGGGGGGLFSIPQDPFGLPPEANPAGTFYMYETFEMKLSGVDKLSDEELNKKLGDIAKEAAKIGMTVSGTFYSSSSSEAEQKSMAIKEAFAKARKKAEMIAELTGGKIGKVIDFKEGDSVLNEMEALYGGFGYPQPYATTGVTKNMKVTADIKVKFELKD